jgi:uncharacterized membrane protein YphA (DoxX/SURF4 family)
MRRLVHLIARVLTAGVFIAGGWSTFKEPGRRVQAPPKIGLPESDVLVRANGLGMLAAGSAMAVGIKPRLSALALAGMLVPTTLAGHRFWEEETDQGRAMQLTQFLKNAATLGSLLQIGTYRRPPRRRGDQS